MFHKGFHQQKTEPKEVVLAQRIPIREIMVVEEMRTPQKGSIGKNHTNSITLKRKIEVTQKEENPAPQSKDMEVDVEEEDLDWVA
jgi:hypothetical protein